MNPTTKPKAHVERIKAKRKKEWETIQREWPGLAKLLIDFNKTFGKPAKFEYKL